MAKSIFHFNKSLSENIPECLRQYEILLGTGRSVRPAWPELCWQANLLMSTAKKSLERSVAGTRDLCNVFLSAGLSIKNKSRGKWRGKQHGIWLRQRIVFKDEEGSLSNSFCFVPLSQHLSERLETDKESEREQSSTDRHLCLPAEWDVFFWTHSRYLRRTKTHSARTHTQTVMIQFSDSVITCWWGPASPAQWGGVCLCAQTVCAGPEALRRHNP